MSKAQMKKRRRKRSSQSKGFVEIRISSKQFPSGVHSILYELEKGTYTYMQAALYAVRLLHGNWESGDSNALSASELAKMCAVSVRHVFRLWSGFLNSVEGFVKRTSNIGKPGKYKMVSHFCADEDVPLDGDGRTLKCAVAGGKDGLPGGGILERFMAGEISAAAFVVWLVLHVRFCDWATQLGQVSMKVLQTACRMGHATLSAAVDELIAVGMLEIVGDRKPNEACTYQLYPKRDPQKEKKPRTPKHQRKTLKDIHLEEDGYIYSHNRLWRQRLKDSRWEMRRKGRKPFRPVLDRELHTIPKRIREDFDIRLPQIVMEVKELVAGSPFDDSYNAQFLPELAV